MNASQHLEQFLSFVDDAERQYRVCKDELDNLEKLQTDLLHAIEFNAEGYKTRNALARKLEQCRKDRRWYKDRVAELSPVVEFLNDSQKPENRRSINQLKNVLGKTRKEENFHAKRSYRPRTLSPELSSFFYTNLNSK